MVSIRACLAALLAACSVTLAGIEDKKVMCGDTQLGIMSMSQYKKLYANQDGSDPLGGCLIEGKFTWVYDKYVELHFLQTTSSSPASDSFRWFNDPSVTLPGVYVDTPPGGYKQRLEYGKDFELDDQHDYLPWYDADKEFPSFYDKPKDSLEYARDSSNKKFVNSFETWLVGVIKSTPGDEAEQAQDDKYRVVPLLGWKWGFTVSWSDSTTSGGFSVATNPFGWLDAPSDTWKGALGAKFGKETQDWYNIELGTPKELLPSPGGTLGFLLGAVGLGARRRR